MFKFITIVPTVALLVGCGKVPLDCESTEAKRVVQQIVAENTKIPDGLYVSTVERVVTQSINDKKEQSCTATVAYVLSDASKNVLLEATTKLDASLVVSEQGYPYTEYLPDATTVVWYANATSNEELAIVNLLGGTDYPIRLQDYLKRIAQDESHPHHIGFLVYASQLNEVYKMAKFTIDNYNGLVTAKHQFEINYKTTIIKVDGKEEYYTEAVVPGKLRAMFERDVVYNKVAKKIVDTQ